MYVDAPLFRSLASLHRAGVSWPQAMASAAGRNLDLLGVQMALGEGASLSDAMAPVVDPLDLALLRAGERTGGLEEALERIAQRHEAEKIDRSTRRGALAYPFVVTHVAALLLPLPDWVQGRYATGLLWSAAVLLPVYAFLYVMRVRRVSPGAAAHPGTRMPRARGLMRSAIEEADARGLQALADCYDGGVPLTETLPLAIDAGAGGRLAWDLHRGGPAVRDGASLSTCWSALPVEAQEELRTAEESGELGQAARSIATRLRFDVEMRRKKIASLLPVAVILLVGGIVAWRLISFYADLYGNLGKF